MRRRTGRSSPREHAVTEVVSGRPLPRRPPQHPLDRLVSEFDRVFGGIPVEGIDLAGANRGSFYLAARSETEFNSRSARVRAWSTLLGYAVFARDLCHVTSLPPLVPRPGPPKPLFLLKGLNPSVLGTMRPVLARFSPEQARMAVVDDDGLTPEPSFEWLSVKALAPRGAARSLLGLDATLRARRRDAVTPLFRRASLRAWLLRMALRTSAAAQAFRRIYDVYPTSVLVTASDTGFWGHCATRGAERLGIPSLTLQHGMPAGEGYVPVISSRFAAWGEATAEWLRERGVPPRKIVVTGAPRLDVIVNQPRRPRAEIARDLGADPSRRWVVLATNPVPFDRNAALLATARAGLRLWGEPAILVVKLHPSEDPAPYRAAIGGDRGVILVLHGKVDLYDLLAASEAVLTFHSSVGAEAMMLDRPVVSLEAFGEENPLDYARAGAAACARTAEDLARALREDVAPGTRVPERRHARERFVRDNLLAADGKSAERVRAVIQSLAAREAL